MNAYCKIKNKISKYRRTSLTRMSDINYTTQEENMFPYNENFYIIGNRLAKIFQLNPFTRAVSR